MIKPRPAFGRCGAWEREMKLKVIEYHEKPNYHDCRDENGKLYRVDLLVGGDLPIGTSHESLVGKTDRYSHLLQY